MRMMYLLWWRMRVLCSNSLGWHCVEISISLILLCVCLSVSLLLCYRCGLREVDYPGIPRTLEVGARGLSEGGEPHVCAPSIWILCLTTRRWDNIGGLARMIAASTTVPHDDHSLRLSRLLCLLCDGYGSSLETVRLPSRPRARVSREVDIV